MSDPRLATSLADLATAHRDGPRVLELFGLDYCCHGRRTLADACIRAGIEARTVLDALGPVGTDPTNPTNPSDPNDPSRPSDRPEWASMGPSELVDHLEAVHHAWLNAELPRLRSLAEKVAGVHGSRHPELGAIAATFEELRADLEPHLAKEELVLFPMVRKLDSAAAAGSAPPAFHCGTLRNPISVMLIEHDRVGVLLEHLRDLTEDYQAPADGCASYRALFDGLAQLEADTHLHVHKENNLLFPAVVDLEARMIPS